MIGIFSRFFVLLTLAGLFISALGVIALIIAGTVVIAIVGGLAWTYWDKYRYKGRHRAPTEEWVIL